MNIFDQNIEGSGLSGIGSELRKAGRKIDDARRDIGRAHEKAIKTVGRTLDKEVYQKVKNEVKRFVKTDLGKVVVIAAIAVCAVHFGPAILEGMKATMTKVSALAKKQMASAAKYMAKAKTKEFWAQQGVKFVKNQAIEMTAKKAASEYMASEARGEQRKLDKEMAAYEKEMEEKYFREMEAEILKESGMTLSEIEKHQTAKASSDFVYSVPQPKFSQFHSGQGRPSYAAIKAHQAAVKIWEEAKEVARKKHASKGVTLSADALSILNNATAGISKNVELIKAEPGYKAAVQQRLSQGVKPHVIQKEFRDSKIYKDAVVVSTVDAVAPIMKEKLIRVGVPPKMAYAVSIDESAKIVENAVGGRGVNPLFVVGGIGALLALV